MLRKIPETSIGTSIVRKKIQGVPRLKKTGGADITASETEQAEEFNGQFTDVFNKNDHSEVPIISRSAPFMDDIFVSKEGVTKLLKDVNPSKALRPNELHRSLQLSWVQFLPISSNSLLTRVKSTRMVSCKYISPL